MVRQVHLLTWQEYSADLLVALAFQLKFLDELEVPAFLVDELGVLLLHRLLDADALRQARLHLLEVLLHTLN